MANKKDYGIKVGDILGLQKILEMDVYNPNSKAKEPQKMNLCECIECGKLTYKRSYDLANGRNISCRCNANKLTSLRNAERSSVKIGNIYGHLTVIEDLGFRLQSRGKQEKWYKCKCNNCGNENFETNGNNLQSGGTTSCGCVSSRGEKYISQILQQNNINFATQYSFNDLKSDKNYKLRFDFAIFEDNQLAYLIEFDGRQHYEEPDAKWKQSYSLKEQQERDKLKNDYCKSNNIKLKRIPYFKIKDISIDTLLDDTFTIK